jgi:hypothetical protein
MAITKNFEAVYSSPKGELYTVVIGNISGTVAAGGSSFNKELEMMSPGLEISYQGNPNSPSKPIIGSSLSASFKITHDQQAKWRSLIEQVEGDVFIVVYNGDTQESDTAFWYGHLLHESCTIDIQGCVISVQFTDGLASLAYMDWKQDDGTAYPNCNLQVAMNNILKKIPGWVAYYNLHASSGTFKNGIYEVALPRPTINNQITDVNFEGVNMLQSLWLQQFTFTKRKQRTEKWRQLPSDPEFSSTYDVLEDICACFGCNFFLSRGWFWMYNRTAVIQFGADNTKVKVARHITSTTSSDFTSAGNASQTISDLSTQVDTAYDFLNGATETRSIPLQGVYMEHEEAGSDLILSEGVSSIGFDNELAASSGFNYFLPQTPVTYANTTYVMQTLRYVLFRWYRDTDPDFSNNALPAYTVNGATRVYYGNGSNVLSRRDPRAYTGYSERTRVCQIEPGSELRLKFAGRISARTDNGQYDLWVGAVAVLKSRIELTDANGDKYRLKRWAKTHWWDTSTSSPDGIKIDGLTQVTYGQVYYYRKYYGELEWVDETHPDYDDAYYEVIIPHGDNNRVEDYYGSVTTALSVPYAGQSVYTPFHVEIDGENVGEGVIFNQKVDDEFGKYWFTEDISLTAPDFGNDFVLLDSHWILEMYSANAGPHPNVDPTTVTGWGVTYTEANVPTGQPNYRSSSWGTEGEQVDGFVDLGPGWPTDLVSVRKYVYPKEFMMSNWAVYLGDGSAEANLVTIATGGPGLEQMGLTSSRIGSRSTYNHQYSHGVWNAKYYDQNGVLQPNNNFVAVTDYPYKELFWVPYKNDDAAGANLPEAYGSLHGLVCEEYMSFFSKSNKMISGTIKPRVDGTDSFFGPYQVMVTDKLDGISTLKLIPLNISWNMMEGTSFTALAIPAGRYTDVEPYQETNNKGPGGGRKPGALPTGKVLASVASIDYNRNVGQQNSSDITDLQQGKDELELFAIFIEK